MADLQPPSAQSVYGETSDKAVSGMSISRYGVIAFLVQMLLVCFVMLAVIFFVANDIFDAQKSETSHAAEQLKLSVSEYIHHYSQMATKISQQKIVLAYYQQGKQSRLGNIAGLLEKSDPGILKVRFVDPTNIKLDTEAVPHLGYAGLEMLRETLAKDEQTQVEVHALNTPNEQLSYARRIVLNDKVVGLLHVSVSLKLIKSMVKTMSLDNGLLLLRQAVDQQNMVDLAETGDREYLTINPDDRIDLPGSELHVAFWVGSVFDLLYSSTVVKYFILIPIFALLIGLIQWSLSKRLASQLRQDQISVIKLFEDFATGKVSSSYHSNLQDVKGLIETLTKKAGTLKQQSTSSSPALTGIPVSENNSPAIGEPELADDNDKLDALLLDPFALDDDPLADDLLADDPLADDPLADSFVDEQSVEVDFEKQPAKQEAVAINHVEMPEEIFLAYDIRGIVDQNITDDIAALIGQSIGSEASVLSEKSIIVGRDGRLSSKRLASSLIKGLLASGQNVIDIGLVPTPVCYFAIHHLQANSCVMVTGSHNPPEYNGFKIVLNGDSLSADRIQKIRRRIKDNDLVSGQGKLSEENIAPEYISKVMEDVPLGRQLKVVLDCGNGAGGEIAPMLLKTLGVDLVELNSKIDGCFPNHHPDPSQAKNMQQLIDTVLAENADIGVAYDGDADRIGVVDSAGNIIWPDRLMMLFSMDILSRNPGADIVFDVKCSRELAKEIVKYGGRPILWKTGHSMIKAKMKETGAILGGEFTGHICIKERWYGFDDAIYATCRLLEIISSYSRTTEEIFAEFPDLPSTPEIVIKTALGENHKILKTIAESNFFPAGEVSDIDGLRVDFEEGWGLIRASNTTPSIVMRFEAEDESTLEWIASTFCNVIGQVAPNLDLPGCSQDKSTILDDDFLIDEDFDV
jgi:phosphomannomutase / phosphoglucomutase